MAEKMKIPCSCEKGSVSITVEPNPDGGWTVLVSRNGEVTAYSTNIIHEGAKVRRIGKTFFIDIKGNKKLWVDAEKAFIVQFGQAPLKILNSEGEVVGTMNKRDFVVEANLNHPPQGVKHYIYVDGKHVITIRAPDIDEAELFAEAYLTPGPLSVITVCDAMGRCEEFVWANGMTSAKSTTVLLPRVVV